MFLTIAYYKTKFKHIQSSYHFSSTMERRGQYNGGMIAITIVTVRLLTSASLYFVPYKSLHSTNAFRLSGETDGRIRDTATSKS